MEEKENVLEEMEEVVEEVKEDAAAEKQTEAAEDKHQKFYRISERRIQNAAKQIELLGNCAGGDYDYTEEDVEKMFGYLQGVLDSIKEKYQKKEIQVFNWN